MIPFEIVFNDFTIKSIILLMYSLLGKSEYHSSNTKLSELNSYTHNHLQFISRFSLDWMYSNDNHRAETFVDDHLIDGDVAQ